MPEYCPRCGRSAFLRVLVTLHGKYVWCAWSLDTSRWCAWFEAYRD